MLTLILAESSIELVPNEITGHPAVLKWAERKKKDPRELILDQSYHHSAILRLGKSGIGRGRPDIVHFCLLLALGSPLNSDNQLNCFVHTRDDHVIAIDPRARLPRNTDRFTALIEQLYQSSMVPSSGPPLMKLRKESLNDLVSRISPDGHSGLDHVGTAETHGGSCGGTPRGEAARFDCRWISCWSLLGSNVETRL